MFGVFVPWWGIFLMAVLYFYLIVVDVRLHRRVERLEETLCKLEGVVHHKHHSDMWDTHN